MKKTILTWEIALISLAVTWILPELSSRAAETAGTTAATAAPATSAPAQPAAAATPPATSSVEQWIQESKIPFSWMTWGGDLRLRNEYFNNAQSLGNPADKLGEQDYFRYRARIWTALTPITNLNVSVRLATEPRTWMKPASYSPFKGKSGTDWTEGIFDNMYVQWNEPVGLPAKLTVGRQDLMMGEGWLFGDGTPYDGSWTYYLDAARLTYQIKDAHTTIDAIGILQYAKDDAWLPTINNQDRYQIEQNEKGAVLYISNKSMPQANLDGYFIYKHDSKIGPYAIFGDNADIYTLGGRVYGVLAEHWKYGVEGAYQFGEKQDLNIHPVSTDFRPISAFGVNSKLTYLFKDSMNNQLSLNYEYLTGDDPGTKTDEMFDLLWGRYPRWSELYNIYSYATESRVGQTANLHRIGPGWTISPVKKMDFVANYFVLLADQEVPTRTGKPGLFTDDGVFRGHYLQTVIKYKFSNHLSGHLWGEFVFPGDFYTYRKVMSFLRAELNLTY